jgi:hypothetical protein
VPFQLLWHEDAAPVKIGATDFFLRVGMTAEILLKMPEEITGEPTTEWLCTGQVVHVESGNFSRASLALACNSYCYQILWPQTA